METCHSFPHSTTITFSSNLDNHQIGYTELTYEEQIFFASC
jgi:hypothetical protein